MKIALGLRVVVVPLARSRWIARFRSFDHPHRGHRAEATSEPCSFPFSFLPDTESGNDGSPEEPSQHTMN